MRSLKKKRTGGVIAFYRVLGGVASEGSAGCGKLPQIPAGNFRILLRFYYSILLFLIYPSAMAAQCKELASIELIIGERVGTSFSNALFSISSGLVAAVWMCMKRGRFN